MKPPPQSGELTYGLRACLAVFERRRGEISQVAFGREARGDAGALLGWAAERRLPCRELPDAELARMAGSANHEGLCVVAQPRRWIPAADLAASLVRGSGAALALDRVRNPYNIGAILRTAAFFGFDALLLGAPAPHPGLPQDAIRVAEGGAEHVALCRTTDLADTLGRLQSKGVCVIGAESDGAKNAFEISFPRPLVVVVGNEREGLSERIRARCDLLAAIPGSGAVGSLNVSIAASILLAQIARSGPPLALAPQPPSVPSAPPPRPPPAPSPRAPQPRPFRPR